MEKKLYRDEYRKKLAGVCAGLAEYFTIDVAIVRILFVLTCIFHGGGLVVYIVLWIALPKRLYPFVNPTVDYTVPPQNPDSANPGAAPNNPFGNSSFQNNPFGNNPFPNQPFSNQPFTNQPFPNQPFQPDRQHRSTSLFALIFGVVLIVVGGSILLDNFDILPDWDFGKLWPVVIIVVGCVLMLAGEKKKPLPADFQTPADDKSTHSTTETNPPADTPPVV
jgi:phage shock protein C